MRLPRRFAAHRSSIVLCSRGRLALQACARECTDLGGSAMVVVSNVTDETAMRDLDRTAVQTFGRIDVWVNNAAVTLFALFEG